jgi:peptidyl-prolyl cis-trans isomerase SurA
MRYPLALSAAALLVAAFPPLALSAQQKPPAPLAPANQATVAPRIISIDRVVAVVGDIVVTQSDLQERIIRKRQENAKIPTDSVGFATFLTAVVNELVDEELLLQKAKDLKIEVPDADVANTVDKQVKEVRGRFKSESEYKTELARAGYGTPEEYKRFLLDGVKREETITRTVKKLREDGKIVPANITDADVQDAFDRNKSAMPRREPSVSWRQIVVAPKPTEKAREIARVKAESLLAEVQRGGDFELLAKRESMDPGSKEKGGDLGWNRRGLMVPEFDRWMFALGPGQLSPVVQSSFGYHIIRVDRVQPSEVKARHILISPKIDSSDVRSARLEADSVAAAWRRGVAFDSLAKKHHDYASKEETTLLTPYPRAQLPSAYQQAFGDRKAGDLFVFEIAGAGNVPAKFVVAQIATSEAGGEMTLAEVKERFRTRLAEEAGVKRLMDQLRKATYVAVHHDALVVMPMAAPTP